MDYDAQELSEKLPFGGVLAAREDGFSLVFYDIDASSGVETEVLRIDNTMFYRYIAALTANWRTFVTLRRSMPQIPFSVEGKLGMRLSANGLRFHVMRIKSNAEVIAVAHMLREARLRGADMHKQLLAKAGHSTMTSDEKRFRFHRFLEGDNLGQSQNPAVIREREIALNIVRVQLNYPVRCCRHYVHESLDEHARMELSEDLRRYGLEVFSVKTDFVLAWKGAV